MTKILMGPIWRNLHEAWVLLFVQSTWPFDLRRSLNTARGTHTENSQRHYQSVPKKGPGAAQSWVHIIGGTVVSICLSFSMREMMIKIALRLGWLEATPVTYLFRVFGTSPESWVCLKRGVTQRDAMAIHGQIWLKDGTWQSTINLFFPQHIQSNPFQKQKMIEQESTRVCPSVQTGRCLFSREPLVQTCAKERSTGDRL